MGRFIWSYVDCFLDRQVCRSGDKGTLNKETPQEMVSESLIWRKEVPFVKALFLNISIVYMGIEAFASIACPPHDTGKPG